MSTGLNNAEECALEAVLSKANVDASPTDEARIWDIGAALWTIAGHLDRIATALEKQQ